MASQAIVHHFFDPPTSTLSYIVQDSNSSACAIIDSVLNLDYPSGTISYERANTMISFVGRQDLDVQWIFETHVHADHLSAAPYMQEKLGGQIAIGANVGGIQEVFGEIFAADEGFARDGSQFDRLLNDGDELEIGALQGRAIHTPGHTPACMSYVFDDAAFVGDTLFMPDYGTARCDFPGGDAATLYRSIRKIMELPADTRIFVCHDYLPDGRELAYESSVQEQRSSNVHIHDDVSEEEFVALREARDVTLGMPELILPSLQVNMRGGHLPPAHSSGRLFLTLPLNAFGGPDIRPLVARE
jgi:glyoxylase-like metal-dependent hydrolase (beta-lactamase superfamily II)